MTEINKTPIPQRLKNVSNDHPYVAGAIDIVDDVDGRSQQAINADTYRKSETYNKTEVNNIAATHDENFVNLEAEDGDTLADIFDGVEGAPQTLYRVGNWDGEEYNPAKYSQYTFDGTNFIPLQVVNAGIDETIEYESSKLIEGGAVFGKVSEMDRISSAEKKISLKNDILIKSNVDVLTSATTGSYIGRDGTISSHEDYFISLPFQLLKGETLAMWIQSNYTVLAEYKNSVYHRQLLVNTVSQDKNLYYYTADEDMYVVVCGRTDSFGYCRKVILGDYRKNSAAEDAFINIDNSDLVSASVLPSGETIEEEGYYITGPIEVSAGDIIECECRYSGGTTGIAALSKVDSGYIPLVVVRRGTEYGFAYLCSENMEVAFSGAKDTPLKYRIISNGKQLTSFPDDKGRKMYSAFSEKHVDDVEVDINQDYGDGYYIDGSTAELVEYEAYFITSPIEVEKGDVVIIDNLRCSGETILAFYYNVQGTISFEKIRVGSTSVIHYENTISKRGKVVVCGAKETRANSTIKVVRNYFEEVATKTDIDEINEKIEELGTYFVDEPIVLNIDKRYGDAEDGGYYIEHGTSALVRYPDYFITSPVEVSKGDKIRIENLRNSGEYILAYYYNDKGTISFEGIVRGSTPTLFYEKEITKDGFVVISGSKDTRSNASASITKKGRGKVATQADIDDLQYQIDHIHGIAIIDNPYAGHDMSRTVLSNTHEHMVIHSGPDYTSITTIDVNASKNRLQRAYGRGIRVFATSHYIPAVPAYPLDGFSSEYQNYTSKDDLTLITQQYSGSIESITVDGNTIPTNTLPQIANAEHPYIKGIREHFNILGLLWAEPGTKLANVAREKNWKIDNALVTPEQLNALLEDETKWQFGSQYVFGTINHNISVGWIKDALAACPRIFKAMEIFNQGYSIGWNQQFRDAYDTVLREGYRIWCTAVVDWQYDWASWGYTTAAEQAIWEARFNELTPEEQEQYGDVEHYYLEEGRPYKFDRGANAVLVPENYDSLTPFNKAKEVVKSYIAGRYYLVGLGNYSINITRDINDIIFTLSDLCPSVKVINGRESVTYTNVDTIVYHAKGTEKYVRLEAEWNDGDFIYTNPIWIE